MYKKKIKIEEIKMLTEKKEDNEEKQLYSVNMK